MAKNNILNDFLALVGETFNAHSAVYMELESELQPAVLKSFWTEAGENFDKNTLIASGKGLIGWILRNKLPLAYAIEEDQQANLGYYANDETECRIRSFMGVPVGSQGVLCVDSQEIQKFNEAEQARLTHFARLIPQIKETMQSAERFTNVNEYFYIFEQISELKKNYMGWSAFIKNFLGVLSLRCGYEYVSFSSLSYKKDCYIIECEYPKIIGKEEFSHNAGIVGWVLQHGESVFNDGRGGVVSAPLYGKVESFPSFTAAISVPVFVNKEAKGVLCLASSQVKKINPEFKLLLRLLAENLGEFLETISLKYQVQSVRKK